MFSLSYFRLLPKTIMNTQNPIPTITEKSICVYIGSSNISADKITRNTPIKYRINKFDIFIFVYVLKVCLNFPSLSILLW